MNLNEAYPSEFLKVEDLNNKNVAVTIVDVTMKMIGKPPNAERKMVISFAGKEKKFVCNKTNAKVIGGLYGDETDHWIGKRITLTPREVEFQGEMMMAIRVSLVAPTTEPAVAPGGRTKAAPPVAETAAGVDSDIPF